MQAEAKQNERGQPHGNVGATLAEKLLDSIRIGEAKQDSQGKESDGKKACQDEYDPVCRVRNRRLESAMLITTAIEPGPVVSGSVNG